MCPRATCATPLYLLPGFCITFGVNWNWLSLSIIFSTISASIPYLSASVHTIFAIYFASSLFKRFGFLVILLSTLSYLSFCSSVFAVYVGNSCLYFPMLGLASVAFVVLVDFVLVVFAGFAASVGVAGFAGAAGFAETAGFSWAADFAVAAGFAAAAGFSSFFTGVVSSGVICEDTLWIYIEGSELLFASVVVKCVYGACSILVVANTFGVCSDSFFIKGLLSSVSKTGFGGSSSNKSAISAGILGLRTNPSCSNFLLLASIFCFIISSLAFIHLCARSFTSIFSFAAFWVK